MCVAAELSRFRSINVWDWGFASDLAEVASLSETPPFLELPVNPVLTITAATEKF